MSVSTVCIKGLKGLSSLEGPKLKLPETSDQLLIGGIAVFPVVKILYTRVLIDI